MLGSQTGQSPTSYKKFNCHILRNWLLPNISDFWMGICSGCTPIQTILLIFLAKISKKIPFYADQLINTSVHSVCRACHFNLSHTWYTKQTRISEKNKIIYIHIYSQMLNYKRELKGLLQDAFLTAWAFSSSQGGNWAQKAGNQHATELWSAREKAGGKRRRKERQGRHGRVTWEECKNAFHKSIDRGETELGRRF